MANDFSKGKVSKNIIAQAIPLTLAQLVQLLYNVVDRVYIGHLEDVGSTALTGVGVTFPIITLIAAFTCLFGMGGNTLFAIARGAKEERKAAKILGNTMVCIVTIAIMLMIICFAFRKPILYAFGASDESYIYADEYLKIYLLGTVFSMLSTGMNGFINSQGFPKYGMMTTVIGALLNIILDPIFIFVFRLGVGGAAIATVISQIVSALWVISFLFGKKTIVKIAKDDFIVEGRLVGKIMSLGLPGFIMQGTNSLVQIVCNSTLQSNGGDLYVGIMTIVNSVRELLSLPIQGITSGSQPVLGYNYGAKDYKRVREGIRASAFIGITYTVLAWLLILMIPRQLIGLFSDDASLFGPGERALKIYFFGFVFMAFQFAGQSVFQALGYAKHAIFFSLFRKVIIVVPLTLILPAVGLGVDGVFWAEPISNLIGGLACALTMWQVVYKKLGKADVDERRKMC